MNPDEKARAGFKIQGVKGFSAAGESAHGGSPRVRSETNIETPCNISFRPYRSGDEPDILALFETSFGQSMSPELWRWFYSDPPLKPADIHLAFHQARLIGHSAGWFGEFDQAGCSLIGSRTQNIMVHPDFRRHGLIGACLKRQYQANCGQGVDFWWAFPTRPAAIQAFMRNGMIPIGEYWNYQGRPALLSSDSYRIKTSGAQFDENDVAIFNRLVPRHCLKITRTRQYLDWRYERHPVNRYRVARLFSGAALEGICVYKLFEKEKTVDLLELVCPPEHLQLLLGSLMNAMPAPTWKINLWSASHDPLHQALLDSGFQRGNLLTQLVYRPVSDSCPSNLQQFENWYLTLGDSDVY